MPSTSALRRSGDQAWPLAAPETSLWLRAQLRVAQLQGIGQRASSRSLTLQRQQDDHSASYVPEPHFYELCAQILLCAQVPPPVAWRADLGSVPFPESEPKVVAAPDDQRLVPLKCVRPVIWRDDDFPGFSGTCFLARAMGHDLALTARHVLGGPNPDNMAIPVSLEFGPMGVAEPPGVFWYNLGAYDHVSDLAVALLNTHVDGALDLASVGFTSLQAGETAMIVGFPKALSRVDYDINAQHRKLLGVPDASPFRALFLWNPDATASTCVHAGGPADLGRVEFSSDLGPPDGMSGSPLFVMRKGKLWVAGMLVRASQNVGHFIPGLNIKPFVALNYAKSPAVVEQLIRVIVDGREIVGSPGAMIVHHVVEHLSGIFGGDRARVEEALQDWPKSEKALLDLALERAGDEMMQNVGGSAQDMWEQGKLLRSLRER